MGGSGGKYHCSLTLSRDEREYPGEIGFPLYRAGEAGSLVKNLGIRKDVPESERRSLTLSRRDDFEGCNVSAVDMVATSRRGTMDRFYGTQLLWVFWFLAWIKVCDRSNQVNSGLCVQ